MMNVNFCTQCGHKVNNGSKFCPSCGNSIVEEKNIINHNTKRDKVLNKKRVSNKKGLVTTAIIVLVVSALIFYFNTKASKEEAVIEKQPKITGVVNYPSSRFDHYYSVAFAQNGKIILPLDVVKDKKFVKISIREGRNRQVRKMFEKFGYFVDKLHRSDYGNLKLGTLKPGEWRKLTQNELENLNN